MKVGGADQPIGVFKTEAEARALAKKTAGNEVIVQNNQGRYEVYSADKLSPGTLAKLKSGSAATSLTFEVERPVGPGSAAQLPKDKFEEAANSLGVFRKPGEGDVAFNKRVQTEINRILLTYDPPDSKGMVVVDGKPGPKTAEAMAKAYDKKAAKAEVLGDGDERRLFGEIASFAKNPPAPPAAKSPAKPAGAASPYTDWALSFKPVISYSDFGFGKPTVPMTPQFGIQIDF